MSIKDKVPCLKEVYTFDRIEGAKHWSELCLQDADLLQQVDVIKKTIPVEQVATFIYTSGTTGTPKGVMLTHHNIYFNLQAGKKSFPFPDSPNQKVLSFLPLNHIFEKVASYIYMYSGMSIYYAESLETIGENLKEIKKFYDEIKEGISNKLLASDVSGLSIESSFYCANDFKVTLLRNIKQNRIGSFYGSDDGATLLQEELISTTNWNDDAFRAVMENLVKQ